MKKFDLKRSAVLFAMSAFAVACGQGTQNAAINALGSGSVASTGSNCGYWNAYASGCAASSGNMNDPQTFYNLCTQNAQYGYGGARTYSSGGRTVCRMAIYPGYSTTSVQAALVFGQSGAASGGIRTGISVFPGDSVYIATDGHYSPAGHTSCQNVSVLGHWDSSYPINPLNGKEEGLYVAYVDSNGNYTSPLAVTTQMSNSSANAPQLLSGIPSTGMSQLVIGYNAQPDSNGMQTIYCGDVEFSTAIARCMDSSLKTYPCN